MKEKMTELVNYSEPLSITVVSGIYSNDHTSILPDNSTGNFVISRKGTKQNPELLCELIYGYGGFSIWKRRNSSSTFCLISMSMSVMFASLTSE